MSSAEIFTQSAKRWTKFQDVIQIKFFFCKNDLS